MSTLNDFISAIKTGGLAKPSKYQVTIAKPNVVRDLAYRNDTEWRKLLMFCDQASLPGVNYTTTQSRTFGEFREMPYERIFDPLTLGFYCDQQMWIKRFFDLWISNIQNSNTREFSYYKDYTVDVEIAVLDNQNKKTYSMKFFECYPKTINQIALDYSAKDVMKLSVTMQYRYWESYSYSKTEEQQRADPFRIVAPVQTPFDNFIAPQELGRNTFEENLGNIAA
jgi:hypothetical protein